MSKMVKCKACGKEVAKGAKSCPNCGKDNRGFIKKHKILSFILIIIVIGVIVSAFGGEGSSDNTSSEGSSSVAKEDSKVNYENFLSITMGESLSDVIAIFGEGTEQSSSEISGIKTVMYTWDGKGISNMNVTIQNDVVTGKAQMGLKSIDSGITMDKYNQVTEGMSYEEVKAILGEGIVTSETKIMDIDSIMYSYINKNGSNANFTFSGDKLQLKAQFNLE